MAEDVLVQLAIIIVLGIGAQWIAWRLELPAILLLLIAGLMAGPGLEFLGFRELVAPDQLLGDLLAPLVSLAVAVILFEGGLSLRLSELSVSGGVIRNLVSLGAIVTWLISTVAARWTIGLSWPMAILLGAILVVTGPTVIGPVLRHVRPSGRVGPILMWEGIVIDPIGAIVAVLVVEQILSARGPGEGLAVMVWGGMQTVLIGGLIGMVGALVMVPVLRRFWLPDYLHNPVTLMVVVAAFTIADQFRADSGLIAVTALGLILANQRRVSVRHIAEFKESLTVLLVSVLFIVLSARLTTDQLAAAGWGSLVFTIALILVARPASVIVATIGSGLEWRERLFLMAMAPRGIVAAAVASVFALRLDEAGAPGAEMLVPVTFTAIIGTVTVYGLAAGWAARRLGLTGGKVGYLIAGANPVALTIGRALRAEGVPILLVDTRTDRLAPAESEGLPTLHASILSPFVRERIDPGLIGRLLALTPSEEVNSLASLHFAGLFGRENTFQLTPEPHESVRSSENNAEKTTDSDSSPSIAAELDAVETQAPSRSVALELHGRVLFGPGITYRHLDSMLKHGAAVQRIEVEDGNVLDQFRDQFGDDAIPLFVVDDVKNLLPVTADSSAVSSTARGVIGLTPPRATGNAPREDGA